MKKILIVDDEKDVRDLLEERLTQSKYTVRTAANGKEALNIAATTRPDLVLLDIAMPEMDGYLTCENLKKSPKTRDIPILFLTGKDLDPDGILQRCRDLGAAGHFSKLSSLTELLKKIKEIIGAE